jgi:hypothetical protein
MFASWRMMYAMFVAIPMAVTTGAPAQEPTDTSIAKPKTYAATRREFKPDVVPFGPMLLARMSPRIVEQRVCQGGWHLIVNGDPTVPGFEELKEFFHTVACGYKGRIDTLLVDTSTVDGQSLYRGQFNETRPLRVVLELYKSEPPPLPTRKNVLQKIWFTSRPGIGSRMMSVLL